MLVVLPFTLAVTLSQRRHIKPAFDRVRDCFSSLNAFAQETIAGNRVVKAFAKEDYELEKFDRENDGYRDAQLNAASIWMKYIPMFEVLSQCLTIILMIMGGFMVIDGEMTIGNMVTVNGYLWMLNSPLRQAGWIINDLQRFLICGRFLCEIFKASHQPSTDLRVFIWNVIESLHSCVCNTFF